MTYAHDGTKTSSDTFSFSLSDGAGNSGGTHTLALTIALVDDQAPSMTGDLAALLDEGAEYTLNVEDLGAVDADTLDPTQIIYTVTPGPDHGTLSLLTFSLAQLMAGEVSNVHDGSETVSDSFSFNVADTDGNSGGSYTFNIAITLDQLLVGTSGADILDGAWGTTPYSDWMVTIFSQAVPAMTTYMAEPGTTRCMAVSATTASTAAATMTPSMAERVWT